MKKDVLLINGDNYGYVVVGAPGNWRTMSEGDKKKYISNLEVNAKKGKYGSGSKAANVREHYAKKYNILN